jgi:phosphopantetheinyl transferase (holo-ACP synthase)
LIGNDIVDLQLAAVESNWKRKGYLEKIFTPTERFLIHTAKDAEMMVWLLWTMKESVYKAATDRSKIKTFTPYAFDCNNLVLHEDTATGSIIYEHHKYFCQSSLTSTYIHTIAAAKPVLLKQAKLKIIDYDESDFSYRASKPSSVSHHGQYLALIYL